MYGNLRLAKAAAESQRRALPQAGTQSNRKTAK
jgi:hypothetical protein